MTYLSTITQKGQLTIPKSIRDRLNLKRGARVQIKLLRQKQHIHIEPSFDILDLVGKFKTKLSPSKARDRLETQYKRV